MDYICCSTYGKPRSPGYLWSHYKKLLKDCGLPDIRFHDLRHTYATLLTKNDFNLKAISKVLRHSREIITFDVYIEKYEIIEDCTEELSDYIESVVPKHLSLPCDEIGFKNLIPESDIINDYIGLFF